MAAVVEQFNRFAATQGNDVNVQEPQRFLPIRYILLYCTRRHDSTRVDRIVYLQFAFFAPSSIHGTLLLDDPTSTDDVASDFVGLSLNT